MLATISNNDEAERLKNNLTFQQTFKTSTNSPKVYQTKLIYAFSIMDTNRVGPTNRN